MVEFAIWALGRDRPGIVAAVTGVLVEQGCNLRDCSMTILSGHFAMMLLVDGPDDVAPAALEDALSRAGAPLGLSLAVREVEEAAEPDVTGDVYMVAVYGSDRPGIVHRVSTLLAERGVNITDLNTKVIGDPDAPVYAMHLEVTVPETLDPDQLATELAAAGRDLGVDTSIHRVEPDVF